MSTSRRVVITGMGLISPLGNDKHKLWSALQAGESGIRPLQRVPSDGLPISVGGEAIEFTGHISEFGELEPAQKKAIRKGLKVMCREIQMGVAASQLAFQDAGLAFDAIDRDRTGIVYGSDYIMTMPDEFEAGIRSCMDPTVAADSLQNPVEFEKWAEQGLPKVTPLWLLKYLPNMPACHVAIYNDLRGPNNSLTVREASPNLALGEAFCTIERGHADAMVTGATGSRVHPIKTVHVALQEELALDNSQPDKVSRPFDANRTGMVIGEGAASLILEELSSAEKRGATPLAEVVGFGSSAVIDRQSVAHRDVAVENAIRQALRSAKMNASEIGHVNAHGLSSVKGDREEATAIANVFGANGVPVVAPKSFMGNIGAGGGAVELIASVMALKAGSLFPTLNFDTPDPECPVAVTRSNETPAGNSVMNVNVTPQGQAAAVIVRSISA